MLQSKMLIKEQAENLLEEWRLCRNARCKGGDAITNQIKRDSLDSWANSLTYNLAWGNESEITEAFYQFQTRYISYKENVIIGILKNGAIQ